ncbi:3-oxoacyl-ACP reductase [Streptomyces phytohabitans]
MVDRYLRWTRTGPGRFLTRRLGLPAPARLHRWSAERPTLEGGPLLHLTAGRSAYDTDALAAALDACGLVVRTGTGGARPSSTDTATPRESPESPVFPVSPESSATSAVLLDATGIRTIAELDEIHSALHPVLRDLSTNGRVVVLGSVPDPDDHHQAAAQQALEGFVRSLGKELGKGRTAQLVRLRPAAEAEAEPPTVVAEGTDGTDGVAEVEGATDARPAPAPTPVAVGGGATRTVRTGTVRLGVVPALDDPPAGPVVTPVTALPAPVAEPARATGGTDTAEALRSTFRFLLSPRSAYVSGQVITLDPALPTTGAGATGTDPHVPADPAHPLAGRTALVTGAARGIGATVARTLARDGAHVVLLDVPQSEPELSALAESLGGRALPLDITAPDAGDAIVAALPCDLDVLVHNAGITRDRRLVNMPADRWRPVLDVNLASVLRTTDHLLASGAVRAGGRVVATASIAGIAGNTGQTNYAASKAGVIGMVRSLAPRAAAEYGVTVNAVAPGFIETRMTAAIPLVIREAGRRMNSLSQGGLPEDVAETVAWFADPGSGAVNGQVVRVCGQSLLGA